MLEKTNLVGPAGEIKERLAAYKEAGVTHLSVSPVGGDAVSTVEKLKKSSTESQIELACGSPSLRQPRVLFRKATRGTTP